MKHNRFKELLCCLFGHDFNQRGSKTDEEKRIIYWSYEQCGTCGIRIVDETVLTDTVVDHTEDMSVVMDDEHYCKDELYYTMGMQMGDKAYSRAHEPTDAKSYTQVLHDENKIKVMSDELYHQIVLNDKNLSKAIKTAAGLSLTQRARSGEIRSQKYGKMHDEMHDEMNRETDEQMKDKMYNWLLEEQKGNRTDDE